jgi:hypothetical protein
MKKNTCILNDVLLDFAIGLNNISDVSYSWNNINYNLNRINAAYIKLKKITEHIHKNHLHQFKHDAKDTNIKKSGFTTFISEIVESNYINDCVFELFNNVDTDHDNLIYGYDFIYDTYDCNTPKMLKDIQESIDSMNGGKKYDKVRKYEYSLRFSNSPKNEIIRQIIMGEPPICEKFIIDPDDKSTPPLILKLQKSNCDLDNPNKLPWSIVEEMYEHMIPKREIKEEKKKLKKKNINSYICTRLYAELIFCQDIDRNNLIFGKDFTFDNFDNDHLQCLKCIENIGLCVDLNSPDLRVMTWEEYCNTFSNKNPDDRNI